MKEPFAALRERADYTEVGGAPLLGVNGVIIICHGNSKTYSFRNAIKHAKECGDQKLKDKISSEILENLDLIQEAKKLNNEL